jgi:predicted RNA-binding Zn ribbon-like protein
MAAFDGPEALRPVESFANSVDVETGRDDLDSTAGYGAWLAAQGFPGVQPRAADLDLARSLRDALRAELAAHHPGAGAGGAEDPDARARLDALAARIPLRAGFGASPATLQPAGEGALGLLGTVLAAVVLAERDGTWHRLKLCPADDCRWVYYDRSRNTSKAWCSMDGCGNRAKTRAYRGRRSSER